MLNRVFKCFFISRGTFESNWPLRVLCVRACVCVCCNFRINTCCGERLVCTFSCRNPQTPAPAPVGCGACHDTYTNGKGGGRWRTQRGAQAYISICTYMFGNTPSKYACLCTPWVWSVPSHVPHVCVSLSRRTHKTPSDLRACVGLKHVPMQKGCGQKAASLK